MIASCKPQRPHGHHPQRTSQLTPLGLAGSCEWQSDNLTHGLHHKDFMLHAGLNCGVGNTTAGFHLTVSGYSLKLWTA